MCTRCDELEKQVNNLQIEKLKLLRDWSDSQNVFVKSVKSLEYKVAERDERIRELLGIKKGEYCTCKTPVPSKASPYCRACGRDIKEFINTGNWS
jgi:hypothetical protein